MGERELGELRQIVADMAELVQRAGVLLAGQCTHEDAHEITTMGGPRRWHCRACGRILLEERRGG